MSLNLFRRLDRFDRRIRQLERTEPEAGGGGGGDHADSDHADAFSALSHAHAGVYAPVEHDTTHDDRFSQLTHFHSLESLSDVIDVSAPLPGGYVLMWDEGSSDWTARELPATGAPGDWIYPTLGTGWAASAGDQAPRYRSEGTDLVRLDGVAARTSGSGTVIFSLMSTHRPAFLKRYHTPSGTASAFTRIAVASDGTVSQTAGTDFSRTSLDGIIYPLD